MQHNVQRYIWLSLLVLLLAACGSNGNKTPVAPTGLTATPGEGKVTLRWQDRSDNETGFSIFRQVVPEATGLNSQQADDFTKIDSVAANVTQYEDKTVKPGTLYRYGITANSENGSSARVTTEETPVKVENRAPSANAQTLSTSEDTALELTLSGTDPDGDALSYSVTTQPAHGALSGDAPTLIYTPNPNYNGTDSFTFTVSDGAATSSAATVTLKVGQVNDAPTASAQSVSTDEDTPLTLTLTGSDDEGDALSFTIVQAPNLGSLGDINQETGEVRYTPDENENGSDSFTFTVSDGEATSSEATVSVLVEAVNDAPSADDQEVSTEEDTPVTITLTGSDTEGDALTFAIATPPSKGSLGTLDSSTGEVRYTPDENENGADSFSFTVSDGEADSAEATVTINLGVVNDAPVADAQEVETAEDTPLTLTLSASDPDSDTLTYEVVTQPTNGSLSGDAPNLTYTSDENYNGADSFTFKANDGNDDSEIVSVSLSVTPVNDAPTVASEIIDQMTNEDEAFSLAVTANFSDVDAGDTLSYSASLEDGGALPDWLTFENGSFSGTPGNSDVGSFSITVTATDTGDAAVTDTFSLTVENTNDAPVIAGEETATLTTNEDESGTLTLSASDDDGDTLTWSISTPATSGQASVSEQGEVSYAPAENYNGADSFVVSVEDGNGGSDSITVNVTVESVNDAPSAVDDTGNTDEDTATTVDVLANDSDADANTLSIAEIEGQTATEGVAVTLTSGATVTVDGTLSYDPNGAFESLNEGETATDTFGYTLSDGTASSAATVSITITGVDDVASGELDTSFNEDGIKATRFGGRKVALRAFGINNGYYYAAGYIRSSDNINDFAKDNFILVKYDRDGNLVTSFGNNGFAVLDFQGGTDRANDLAFDSSGNIIVAGYMTSPNSASDTLFALAKFDPNGNLLGSFDGNGKLSTNFFAGKDVATVIAQDSAGNLYLAGYAADTSNPRDTRFAIAKYAPDGALVPSFGNEGRKTVNLNAGGDRADAIALDSSGNIYLAGTIAGNQGGSRLCTA